MRCQQAHFTTGTTIETNFKTNFLGAFFSAPSEFLEKRQFWKLLKFFCSLLQFFVEMLITLAWIADFHPYVTIFASFGKFSRTSENLNKDAKFSGKKAFCRFKFFSYVLFEELSLDLLNSHVNWNQTIINFTKKDRKLSNINSLIPAVCMKLFQKKVSKLKFGENTDFTENSRAILSQSTLSQSWDNLGYIRTREASRKHLKNPHSYHLWQWPQKLR